MLSMCGKRKGGQDNHGNGDVFPLALIGGNPVASAAAYRPVDHRINLEELYRAPEGLGKDSIPSSLHYFCELACFVCLLFPPHKFFSPFPSGLVKLL
ncbi:hypothetical protein AGOR_G00082570 [Albula goreensis]|uniref:Uncharacterized protein n=1 Tax=Albula goreensis TaxID=1534307 RepID=A0A8T3DN00_9TELE|nr:hypothetical protein AGOR_G00082570 [Albula goreensis]